MADNLSGTDLSRLADFIESSIGLHFPENRWGDLEMRMLSAAREIRCESVCHYAERILSSTVTKAEIEELAGHLTIGETYFFRENQSLEIVQNVILPAIVQNRRLKDRTIRIWSAGCATGEEAYTIAMMLDRVLSRDEDWNATILATDINIRSLERAVEGVYGSWSFRETPPWIKQRYFRKFDDNHFSIIPELKRYISFAYLNLAEDAYPSLTNNTNAMDIIFCRNVLMYFSAERARRVVQNFHRALTDGGWLVVSPTECMQLRGSQLTPVPFTNVFLYRKDGSEPIPSVSERVTEPVGTWTVDWNAYPPVEREQFDSEPAAQETTCDVCFDGKEDREVSAISYYDEAVKYYAEGRYGEAAALITSHRAEEDFSADECALLAKCYANQGRLDEAAAFSECAIALDKTNPKHHYLHAAIQTERSNPREAVVSLKRTLYLQPDFIPAEVALGHLALNHGDRRAATLHFRNALKILSRYPRDEVILETDGITAGRWIEIIESTLKIERDGGNR